MIVRQCLCKLLLVTALFQATVMREGSGDDDVSGSPDIAGRGIAGVLLKDGIPRKAVARTADVWLRSSAGKHLQEMIPNIPYFVYEDRGEQLFVWYLQDNETSRSNGGWVAKSQVVEWPSRRLCYPRRDGEINRTLSTAFSEAKGLPKFDAKTALPWPIVRTEDASRPFLVLCNLKPFGGTTHPIEFRDTSDLDIYVMFSEREIDQTYAILSAAASKSVAGTADLDGIHQALSMILTQCRVEFLDFTEIERATSAFPGGKMSFLAKRQYLELVKRAEETITRQVLWLSKIGRVSEFRNDEHKVMIVPKIWLDNLAEGAK